MRVGPAAFARGGGFRLLALFLLLAAGLASACDQPTSGPGPEPSLRFPEPDYSEMEPAVEKRLRETRAAAMADPRSAKAWGRFAMVAHAHELLDLADTAYRRARTLDPAEVRWPYYLGDVLSVVGTDLEGAAEAFRRSLALRPGYAPAHMRLGKVLLANGEIDEAEKELERALELVPDLQPARVALAQIRFSQGELEDPERMLEDVLSAAPRHAQALSTLGQVYMRQGRRDEARKIAERARAAASYNLFSDPMMGEVVAEGVSSVLLWERAKSFFDNGNYQQAVVGLRRVVELQPGNSEAHLQLAVSLGNLGDLAGSRRHLESLVALEPEEADPRIRLGALLLDLREPAAAVPHLERALEVAPGALDAGWLLGKARLLSGDPRSAVRAFETAAQSGQETPDWAHNEWGSALAQDGRPNAALAHFQKALATNPQDPRALFYAGLVFEGLGRVDRGVEHYCRSIAAQPNPPAAARLEALGASCPGG